MVVPAGTLALLDDVLAGFDFLPQAYVAVQASLWFWAVPVNDHLHKTSLYVGALPARLTDGCM